MSTRNEKVNGKEIISEQEAAELETEELKESGLPVKKEQIAEQEYDLLEGLLKAAEYQEDENLQKTVRIQRAGTFLFEFRIRPISEDDLKQARKEATTFMKNPQGKHLPLVEKEVDYTYMRCWKIYLSTIPEDREKVWDNKVLKDKYEIIRGAEMVDKLLTAGEKNAVSDLIDTISGYDTDLDEYAKN